MIELSGIKQRAAFMRTFSQNSSLINYTLIDKHHRIQYMSEVALRHTGFSCLDDAINMTVADFECEIADYVDDFKHYEQMCMHDRTEILLLSRVDAANGPCKILVCYKPVLNDKGKEEGAEVWGQALPNFEGFDLVKETSVTPFCDASKQIQFERLSQREQECLYLLARGFTFDEIAKDFSISPRTVESHIKNIKKKLMVASRAELLVRACELGYLQIESRNPHVQLNKLQLLSVTRVES